MSSTIEQRGAEGSRLCRACGIQVPPAALTCPACHTLVHSERLAALAKSAAESERAGDLSGALASWREAAELLPPESRQSAQVQATIRRLSDEIDRSPSRPLASTTKHSWKSIGGIAAAVALFAWKFKAVLAFVLTKGKFLLLGFTKAGTMWSMFATIGVYALAWGWPFALGIVLSIYVHEIGHVVALARYGIRASVPMFIPGVGAMVRMDQYPASPREDAAIGLAGPVWGLGAALACLALSLLLDSPLLAAIARVGAWINLFNLLPVWQLDGGRGLRAISRSGRILLAATAAILWFVTAEGLLLIIAAVLGWRIFRDLPTESHGSRPVLTFLVLLIALSLMTLIPVPHPT